MSPDILLSQAIRERLGHAAFEERRRLHGWSLTWEQASEERRQECLNQADAVVKELFTIIGDVLRGEMHADHAPSDHLV